MNSYIMPATIFVVVLVFWTVVGRSKTGGAKISPSDAKKRLDSEKGIILLDVRSRDEYMKKHIKSSTLIPVNVLANEAGKRLPNKDADIFVYCASGSRSSMAAKILLKMGYTKVYNMGGIFNWPYETVSGNK